MMFLLATSSFAVVHCEPRCFSIRY